MKNIELNLGVVTTPTIERVINALDVYFEGFPVKCTSGKRTQEHQMRIVIGKIKRHGIHKIYQELIEFEGNAIDLKIKIDEEEFYWWQRGWSKLLNIGDIVNPPIPAEVLFDYFRPGSNTNKKGRVIEVSNHAHGNAFDLSGADLVRIGERVEKAKKDGNCFISGHLVEVVNNAVHLDCVPLNA